MKQIDAVVQVIHAVLGEDVRGVYLHGSGGFDRLRPRSDLDVLVVAARSLDHDQRRALLGGLMPLSGRRGPFGRPLELTVVVAEHVRPWRYPPEAEFQYGEWLRQDYEGGLVPPREANPDLAPLLALALEADRAVLGPSLRTVLDPVPATDVRRAIVHGVPGLMAELGTDTTNVILTLARIWTTLATDKLVSKDAAATWAIARMRADHRAVVERARDVYLGAQDRWDDLTPLLQPAAASLVAEIDRLARPA